MLVYLDLYEISPAQEVRIHVTQANIDWDSLSEVFFNKNPKFLKFQLLNLHKYKSKICWTSQQDSVLL